MKAETVILAGLLVCIALTLSACTPQDIAKIDAHQKDVLITFTTPQPEQPKMINTFSDSEITRIVNPYFSIQNSTGEIFRVDHAGNFYLYPLTTCGKLYTDGAGLLTCGTDTDTTYSAGNGISEALEVFSVAGGDGLTQEASGLKVTVDGIGDTQLEYNTGQALTTTSDVQFNNATVNSIVLDGDAANHNIYDNATCIIMKAGTTYLEVCE